MVNNEISIKKKITKLNADIEAYKRAIENAQGALDAAERELDELLSTYKDMNS